VRSGPTSRDLHGRRRRAHRAGRLADDGLPDARRRAVLRRTYFPPEPATGCRASATCSLASPRAWRDKREQIDESAVRSPTTSARRRGSSPPAEEPDATVLARPRRTSARGSSRLGRLGRRAEVPAASVLEFLFGAASSSGREDARRDGGRRDVRPRRRRFHRYSVDERWLVPHFEKCLRQRAARRRLPARLARLGTSATGRWWRRR